MNVHFIRGGETRVARRLEEGDGHVDVGSSPTADWHVPDAPDWLCRLEVIGTELVLTELGEAEIRVNGEAAGFRTKLQNGVRSACSIGKEWAVVVTLDPPNHQDQALAAVALARAASTAALTAGTPGVVAPVRAIALKIFNERTVEVIEATPGLTFGRDASCGYPLKHGFVSRIHAKLVDDVAKGICLQHLGQTHATYVGLKPLKEGESEPLHVGSVVRFTDAFGAPRMEVLALSEVAREKAKLDPDGSLVGESPQFLEAIDRAMQFAAGKGPIVFIAESGTGKSALARIVAGRCRPGGPFVTVDCGAIPVNLIESELFGHTDGAFTGAKKRLGLIQKADGGVILIDEIGDLPLELQMRLLRFLQDGVIRPVGSEVDIRVDVRVIAATHRNLRELVDAGKFREDLFNRLGKLIVRLPSLREYKSDIPAIANARLARTEEGAPRLILSDDAAAALLAYDWPGNVRELQGVIDAAALLSRGSYIEAATIQEVMRSAEDAFKRRPPPVRQAGPEAEPAERAIVAEALRRLSGEPYSQAQAAGQAVERAIVEAAIQRSGGKGSDSLWAELGYENKNALQRRRKKWGV